jgi:hypothetical protein
MDDSRPLVAVLYILLRCANDSHALAIASDLRRFFARTPMECVARRIAVHVAAAAVPRRVQQQQSQTLSRKPPALSAPWSCWPAHPVLRFLGQAGRAAPASDQTECWGYLQLLCGVGVILPAGAGSPREVKTLENPPPLRPSANAPSSSSTTQNQTRNCLDARARAPAPVSLRDSCANRRLILRSRGEPGRVAAVGAQARIYALILCDQVRALCTVLDLANRITKGALLLP